MNEDSKNNDYGQRWSIMPAEVLEDQDLSSHAKLLYLYIQRLSNLKGYCFASNLYLHQITGRSVASVKRDLKALRDKKWITQAEWVEKDGQLLTRAIYTHITGGGLTGEPRSAQERAGGQLTGEPHNYNNINNTNYNARTREESNTDTLKHQTENVGGGVGPDPNPGEVTDQERALFKQMYEQFEAGEGHIFGPLRRKHGIKKSSQDVRKIMEAFQAWYLMKGRRIKSYRDLLQQFTWFERDQLDNKFVTPPHRR